VGEEWCNIKQVVMEVTEKMIGEKKKERNKERNDDDYSEAIQTQNAAKQRMIYRYIDIQE
jgi:hypothetical protein